MTENLSGSSSTATWKYDTTYRLTSEKRTTTNPIWYDYLYDGAGNRTKFIQRDQMGNETGSKGYAFDNANKLTLEGNLASPGANGNIQYTWDSNGNPSASLRAGLTKKSIIGDGFTEYRYDANNQMTRLNDGVTLDFVNNGDGARFSKYDGTNTTKFVYDRRTGTPGLDPVLIETDSGGTTTARYTNERGLIAQKRSSTTSYYHFEAIGTTRQLTNSTETATDSYTMDAWGNSLASSGSTTNPFRYVGMINYYRDAESGLMRLGVREYDAAVGRFVTSDPIRDEPNFYSYSGNSITHMIDPTGTKRIDLSCLLGCIRHSHEHGTRIDWICVAMCLFKPNPKPQPAPKPEPTGCVCYDPCSGRKVCELSEKQFQACLDKDWVPSCGLTSFKVCRCACEPPPKTTSSDQNRTGEE